MAAIVFFAGCSKDDSDGDSGSTGPSASALIAPINNSECVTGVSISDTQSKVTFQWNATENTNSYFLYVKNLNTQNSLQYSPGNQTSYEITLLKGMPYSWYVSSRGSGGDTNSSTWKFYNSGNGAENFAPFPAELVSPLFSSSINGPTVNLQWEADDLDNDIIGYKVYLDSNSNPTTLKGTTSQPILANVTVTANTTYYWKVDTEDSEGNISHSPIFQFKVL